MPAPERNDYNKKLKTKEIRNKVYKDYCAWIATGKSHKSWFYDNDDLTLTWESMERYIKEDDLDPSHKEVAMAKSLIVWEKRGVDMMLGVIEKCQPAIFQMMMRNKFGWDKEVQHKEDNKCTFNEWKNEQKKS